MLIVLSYEKTLVLVAAAFTALLDWLSPYGPEHLEAVIPKGRPIVAAVEAYRQKHGRLPQTLDELVPDFLAEEPQAGSIPACHYLGYRRVGDGETEGFILEMFIHRREKIWYDSRGQYAENWGAFEEQDGWAYTRD